MATMRAINATQMQLANGTFLLFYAGFEAGADKGWMATSTDLLTWTDFPGQR